MRLCMLLVILVRGMEADSHMGDLAAAISAMGAAQHCDIQVTLIHEILRHSGASAQSLSVLFCYLSEVPAPNWAEK